MGRAPKPCLGTPNHPCPRLTHTTRCTDCATRWHALREQARGTRQQRGYDTAHQRARAQLIATLPHMCAYGCGTLITTPQQLVAAHQEDGNPTSPRIPSCVTCNQRAKRPPARP